ncbi:amidohydrolase family protein [Xanthomonas sp. XNM01]|uniref:amidohydrolase family protein n=1 Tax=Xanthomonas sp. XNM01 TaxID=2769289 RepID=UPI00177AC7C3|nr:amidohydrolase family protein [Xanthomonas sp. XNM01]MBD9369133.1 amidohydrolase family protein [Xanthomonas sp. XNM01]
MRLHARLLPPLLLAGIALLPSGGAHATTIAIEGARVFDGREDLGQVTMLLRDGVIQAIGAAGTIEIPADAVRHSYAGCHLVPGLVSDHSHVGNTSGTEHGDRFYTQEVVLRDLRQFQAYGITTVTALGMNGPDFYAIRARVSDAPRLGAQLLGAGPGIGAPQGAPPAAIMGLEQDPMPRPATAEAARAAVRSQAEAGVDLIKLWVDDLGGRFPPMTPEVYRAAIDEAHRHELKVAAHIHDLEPARDLVTHGLDIIAHGVRDRPVDAAFIAAMKRHGTWYVPTVNIDEANYLYAEHPGWLQDPFVANALPPAMRARIADPGWRREQLGKADAPRRAVATNLANLKALHEAGVRIGFGTDSGAMPQRVIGVAEHRELELMIQAGFTPRQALRTATADAAALLGLDDRGVLAAGRRADFVVLSADPLADIRNTRSIEAVWQAGQQVAGPVAGYQVHAE